MSAADFSRCLRVGAEGLSVKRSRSVYVRVVGRNLVDGFFCSRVMGVFKEYMGVTWRFENVWHSGNLVCKS